MAGLTTAISIRQNTFVPWGTDSSSYVEAAHRWADGRLASPLPIQFWWPWTTDPFALTPLGLRPGIVQGTQVTTYPPGLSVLMAAAIRVGGELAPYLIPPVSAGLLVFCSYAIGSSLAGPLAGLLAVGLVALCPVTFVLAVQPMSDVPAASLWALAWAMSLRPGLGAAAAAGAAVALATMVRPNLTPLGVIVLALVASTAPTAADQENRWRRVGVFLAVAALGPVILGWSQAALYGSPFTMGYHPSLNVPRWTHVRPNLELYPRLLTTVHTPLVFVGLLAPFVLWRSAGSMGPHARAILLSAPAFVAITYLLYSPFPPLDELFSLRFMLPGLVALFVLVAGLVIHLARAIATRARFLAPLAVVPALLVAAHPVLPLQYGLNLHREREHAAVAGHYLREALPPNAAIIAGLHSGILAHYTKRFVIRIESIAPDILDAVVDDLVRHGYRPVLVLDDGEAAVFGPQRGTSRFRGLDWPPRAVFGEALRLTYWDFADRAAFLRGQHWPIDTIRRLR